MQVPPAERARLLDRLIRIFPKRRQTNDAQAAHRRRRRVANASVSINIRTATLLEPASSAATALAVRLLIDAASASVQHASRGPSQTIQASPPTFRRPPLGELHQSRKHAALRTTGGPEAVLQR